MSRTLEEFAALTDEELFALSDGDSCTRCGVRLQGAITGRRGCFCEDCYYAVIGEEIDKHPLGGK